MTYAQKAVGTREQNSFTSTKSIESYIGASISLKGSAYALSGSFEAITSYSETESTSVSSAMIGITAETGELSLSQTLECRGPDSFSAHFLAAVGARPVKIDSPKESASWAAYTTFFETFGTHVVTSVTLRARYGLWESNETYSESSQSTLNIKACAMIEGISPVTPGWSSPGCAAYTSDQKRQALQDASYTFKEIVGGSDDARKALIVETTPKTMSDFLNSSTSNEPILNEYTSIWALLAYAYAGNSSDKLAMRQRGLNMEAAFEGYLAFTCPYLTTSFGAPIEEFQALAPDTTGLVRYQCWNKKTGCMSDDDCHLGGVGTSCYCYGNGCIDVNGRDFVRAGQSGSFNEGVNNACYFHFAAHCNCNLDWQDPAQGNRAIWDQTV